VKRRLLRFIALSHNLPRLFILPQPRKLRMPQVNIWRPFGEFDLGSVLGQNTDDDNRRLDLIDGEISSILCRYVVT
jgi:hypothetical protein